MAGIYVHIPFCKTRCIYCGFFSTTLHRWQDEYVDAVLHELAIRKDYLKGSAVETVYIGGGTPSQLSHANLHKLLCSLPRCKEFTVECNPDDVTPDLAELLVANGVNRVSMGVQTFSDERLRFLCRRHSAKQAVEAVRILRDAGISNISIDLMFGFPGETLSEWKDDIHSALILNVEHISAYSLMYEEGTPLYSLLENGKICEVDEELSRNMYYTLIDMLTDAGFEHYEISNFARNGHRSLHNSSYWHNVPYLGLGAGAHSYNTLSRQWNVEDVILYINKVNDYSASQRASFVDDIEILDEATKYNDTITTGLRTHEGISVNQGRFTEYMKKNAEPLINRGLLAVNDECLHLTRKALYVSDDVMSELIFTQVSQAQLEGSSYAGKLLSGKPSEWE